jgi:hypothetical protein
LTVEYRRPFELLAVAVKSEQLRVGVGIAENAKIDIWLPGMDSNHDLRPHRYQGRPFSVGIMRGSLFAACVLPSDRRIAAYRIIKVSRNLRPLPSAVVVGTGVRH